MKKNARTRNRILKAMRVTSFLVVIQGCGGDSGSGPQMTAVDYAESGWGKFAGEYYSNALDEFDKAIATDANYADGYLGAGWTNLFLNDVSAARSRFATGKSKTDDSMMIGDFHAGLCLAWIELGQYNKCIASADSCMAIAQQYSFQRHSSINHVDLIAAKAKAYFLLGGDSNLATAAELVHQIIPSINLEPGNSDTWVVRGQQYDTFSEALLRALEEAAETAGSN